MHSKPRSRSALRTVLRALIPYTRENILLSFKPNQFFNELERNSSYSRKTLQNALSMAEEKGYIKHSDEIIQLTNRGKQLMQPYIARELDKHARLMVIFDIPEHQAHMRRQLRTLLREWKFTQAQKSVWISKYDYGEVLVKTIKELGADEYVQVFECAKIY